jgi:hypothetical protein
MQGMELLFLGVLVPFPAEGKLPVWAILLHIVLGLLQTAAGKLLVSIPGS